MDTSDSRRKQPEPLQLPNRKHAVSASIKDYILTNHLRPGDPLPAESELCQKLGVSRSSVREATRRLEALDIVSVRQGAGSFVGSLSMSPLVEALVFKAMLSAGDDLATLREVVKVRRYLDLGVADKICYTLKGTQQQGLEILVDLMVQKASSGQTFTQEDFAFHDGLLALSGNEVVRQLITSFWQIHMAVVPRLGLNLSCGLEETAAAHGLMLKSAQAGDVRAYEQAVWAHYRPIEKILEDRK